VISSKPLNHLFPCSRILIHELRVPSIYGAKTFATICTRSCQLSLSGARSIQSTSFHPNSLRSIFNIILPSTLQVLQADFPFRHSHQIMYILFLSPVHITFPPTSTSLEIKEFKLTQKLNQYLSKHNSILFIT
jgi:hypothetical protein